MSDDRAAQRRRELRARDKPVPPPMGDSWREDAACKGVDTNIFFPVMGDYTNDIPTAATTLCDRCPVSDDCLTYALDAPTTLGIWAGTHIHATPAASPTTV